MNRTTIASLVNIRFQQQEGKEGSLTVIPDEGPKGLGIPIRRVFTITNVPVGGIRGDHAHRDCTQVVVCLRGRVSIEVDDARDSITVVLESAGEGLSIPPGLWNKLTLEGPDTVLAVFCDQPYAESDYLRDRREFEAFKGVRS
ncbi:MAG: FdtA/QdtA family cupin domain-containing protein [Flavobacteriales bacterium]|nr:FdtA/QdtA family cupin domain-containing protein [Flavobacteriales bacterium]